MALYKKIRKRQRSADNLSFYEVGDIVDLDPSQIRNFADQWERVGPEDPDPDALPAMSTLELRSRGGGWWDIVNTDLDKVLNPKPLRHADAEKLLNELT